MNLVEKLTILLQNIYLFNKQSPEDVKKISKITEKKSYHIGEVIVSEGEKADRIFLIEYGSVKLVKAVDHSEQQIGLLGSGAHFGELPFIDGLERALSVEAIEKSTIFEIPYNSLKKLMEENIQMSLIFYRELAHYLAIRLRKANADLSYIREQNLKHF